MNDDFDFLKKIKNDVNSSKKTLNSSSTLPGFLYILEIIYFLGLCV